jgi:hypothetical protein
VGALKQFEIEALRLLLAGIVTDSQFSAIEQYAGPVVYEYTGSGYYLTIEHQNFVGGRRTCSEPAVVGEAGPIRCGFIAFLDNGSLVLECHTWGDIDVPDGFRDLDVHIGTPEALRVGGPQQA